MKYQPTKHAAVQNAINTKNLYATINDQFSSHIHQEHSNEMH